MKKQKKFTDLHDAWVFLYDHPIFQLDDASVFYLCLSVEIIKVNPKTGRTSKKENKSTATRILLTCGPYYQPDDLKPNERKLAPEGIPSNDTDLLTIKPTFEQAVIALANKVRKKYSAGKRIVKKPATKSKLGRKKIRKAIEKISKQK